MVSSITFPPYGILRRVASSATWLVSLGASLLLGWLKSRLPRQQLAPHARLHTMLAWHGFSGKAHLSGLVSLRLFSE
jgi:hypothetical protein